MLTNQRILNLLKTGKENAITGKRLAYILEELDDRKVRKTIFQLIKQGYPILSSVSGSKGYYLAKDYQEVLEYRETLLSRIRHDALRLSYLKKAVKLSVEPKQGVLI